MKTCLQLTAALLLTCCVVTAQGLKNKWYGSYAISSTVVQNPDMKCSHMDNSGNLYVAGISASIVDYDVFTAGTTYAVPSPGLVYFWLCKYDISGNLLFGNFLYSDVNTVTDVQAGGITTDGSGNVYLTGSFKGNVDFDPGTGTANRSATTGQAFLAKYSSSGAFLWARNFGSSNTTNKMIPEDIAIHTGTGNIYIGGWYVGTSSSPYADADPGTGTAAMAGVSTSKCTFISAYSPAAGNYVANSLWGTNNSTFSPSDDITLSAMAFDAGNNIYMTGQFETQAYLNECSTAVNSTATQAIYLIKRDVVTGACASYVKYGSSGFLSAYDIDLDGSNNVYIVGTNGTSGIMLKYNSSLVFQYLRTGGYILYGVDVDNTNMIHVVGDNSGIFVQKYNAAGTAQYGSGFTCPMVTGNLYGKEIKVYNGNIFIGGMLRGTQDMGFNYDTCSVTGGNISPARYDNFFGKYVFDNLGPVPVISTTASSPTSITPIPITIDLDEEANGFTSASLQVNNCNVTNFTRVNDTTYTADLVPIAQGQVDVEIFGADFYDYQNNPNMGSNQLIVMYDAGAPTVTISSTSSNPTNVSPIPVTFTFSENVSGFAVGDINVTNGSASNFVTVSASVYTADITPSVQGTVTVSVNAGVCTDGAANPNVASSNFTRIYDTGPPSVTVTTSASSPTNQSPFPVTLTFSETVNNFTLGDITVTNGSASNFTIVSGSVYTADITPSGQGTVTVRANASVCTDAANNSNTASNILSVVFDNAVPTVMVSTTSSSPTNVSPIPVTFTFSENVTGFTIGDITVGNGTAGNFTTVSGSVYTANITPSSQGTVTISTNAGTCTDAANNSNSASNTLSVVFDNAGPTAVVSTTSSSPTNVSPIPVTFTFSENVTGFTVGDITVSNGAAGNFIAVSGSVYTADITPSAQGTVTVATNAGTCTDAANNSNSASNTLSVVYDNAAPTVVLSTTAPSPTNVSPVPVTITFSENVSGFTVSDITVSNGTAGNFTTVSGSVYTVDISPVAQGTITISVNGSVCTDAASNPNAASNQLSIVFDSFNPSPFITSTASSPTSVSPIPVTITFNENVSGFTITDLTVGNGTPGNFVQVTGSLYTVDITPASQGTVTVDVFPSVCTDDANNGNIQATQFSIIYQLTTGINYTSGSNLFTIFPNPSEGQTYFTSATEGIMEIFTSLGQLILKKEVKGQENGGFRLDVPGIYFVRFSASGGGKQELRLVISR